jgi:hypothetical protein
METVRIPTCGCPLYRTADILYGIRLMLPDPAYLWKSHFCPSQMILPDGTLCGHLETVGNPDGVDALVQQVLGLLQQSAAQHHHARRPISDLVVLKHKNQMFVQQFQPVLRDSDPGIRDGKQIRIRNPQLTTLIIFPGAY